MQETLKDWYYYPGTSVPKLNLFQKTVQALAGVAQWIKHQPANQRVAGSIPSQGVCLGCGPGA